ncbi:HIT zinc finger family protein [Acanthocheilonema viteae]
MNINRTTQAQRHSVRLHAAESTRVLDEVTRKRRLRKQLEALEQIPTHNCSGIKIFPNSRMINWDNLRLVKERLSQERKRKMEEETLSKSMEISGFDAYNAARAPPSCIPPRQFCAACGFFSKYTCIRCGVRYCSINCRDLHNDTRCLKWTM